MRVVDQIAAGPRLRAVLLQVDGKRILLAANGDQAPALLDLGATPVSGRPLAASRSRAKNSTPKKSSSGKNSSGKTSPKTYAPGWNVGVTMPVKAIAERRLFDRATGGEIQ